ncbi:MAG: RrF2 family transcriptional regulator [Intestinibacter sp.]|uniref:RrF2 family transcriptional regulator n=1 Tax=Intestinibacter sp. TaxID=1965304 RepID=UPI003F1381BE
MKVSRRFQLAVHTILFIAANSDEKNLTCEYISKEIKCNPVVIKNILNILYKNNFLIKSSTVSGIKLKKSAKDITLWDIYKITDEINIKDIFSDDNLQITNPIVADLSELLTTDFEQIIQFMKETLSKVSIETLLTKHSQKDKISN